MQGQLTLLYNITRSADLVKKLDAHLAICGTREPLRLRDEPLGWNADVLAQKMSMWSALQAENE